MPTPEEVAHALDVLKALEASVEVHEAPPAADPDVVLTPVAVGTPPASVGEAAPSEPVKTAVVYPALIATRIAQFKEVLRAYESYAAGNKTQHETDADVRAFDQVQTNSLFKALSI